MKHKNFMHKDAGAGIDIGAGPKFVTHALERVGKARDKLRVGLDGEQRAAGPRRKRSAGD